MCRLLIRDSPSATTVETSSTTRLALGSSESHSASRSDGIATPSRSRMVSSCRKLSWTNSSRLAPSSSFRLGISAVCGTGSPSG